MRRSSAGRPDDVVRTALQEALPRTWRIETLKHSREGSWTASLTHLRTDRALAIELVAPTLDDVLQAARRLVGTAGIADARPPPAAVVITIGRTRV